MSSPRLDYLVEVTEPSSIKWFDPIMVDKPEPEHLRGFFFSPANFSMDSREFVIHCIIQLLLAVRPSPKRLLCQNWC